MTAIIGKLSARDWVALLDQQGWPCACDGTRLCLVHYGTLDDASRARARRAAGIGVFLEERFGGRY